MSFSCRIFKFLRTLTNEQGVAVLILDDTRPHDLRLADMISIQILGCELARDTPKRLLDFSDWSFKEPYCPLATDGLEPALCEVYARYACPCQWNADVIEVESEVCILKQFHRSISSINDIGPATHELSTKPHASPIIDRRL